MLIPEIAKKIKYNMDVKSNEFVEFAKSISKDNEEFYFFCDIRASKFIGRHGYIDIRTSNDNKQFIEKWSDI